MHGHARHLASISYMSGALSPAYRWFIPSCRVTLSMIKRKQLVCTKRDERISFTAVIAELNFKSTILPAVNDCSHFAATKTMFSYVFYHGDYI